MSIDDTETMLPAGAWRTVSSRETVHLVSPEGRVLCGRQPREHWRVGTVRRWDAPLAAQALCGTCAAVARLFDLPVSVYRASA